MIFAARQIQEKSVEQSQDPYITFVDLTKAFGSVSREGLWKIMSKFGCPDRFVKIVRQFHDGMMARFLDDGNASDAFQMSNRVKQGCVLGERESGRVPSASPSGTGATESSSTSGVYRPSQKSKKP